MNARRIRIGPAVRAAFEAELARAHQAHRNGEPELAWHHLERAHILGQRSTRLHVRAHWQMLRQASARRSVHEIAGQLLRITGAMLLSRIWIPEGNTGGANVSAFRPMPIPKDLVRILEPEPWQG